MVGRVSHCNHTGLHAHIQLEISSPKQTNADKDALDVCTRVIGFIYGKSIKNSS